MISFHNILPFCNLGNDQFIQAINGIQTNCLLSNNVNSIDDIVNKKFDQFSFGMNNDTDGNTNFNDNDPNSNFFTGELDITELTEYIFHDNLHSIKSHINDRCLSLCSFNVNRFSKNLDTFVHEYMSECKFSIVSLVETKLTPDIENLFNIDGYQMYSNCYKRNSGGVSMYISDKYTNHFERTDLRRSTDCIECLFVELSILGQAKNILVGVVYHRPSSSGLDFLRDLSRIFSNICKENKKIYITGDFNFDLLKHENSLPVRNLIDLLHGYNLLSLINKPTRVTNETASIIDHIWSNVTKCSFSGAVTIEVTDHYPTFPVLSFSKGNDNSLFDKRIYRFFGKEFSKIQT